MIPTPLPNENQRAFRWFQRYVAMYPNQSMPKLSAAGDITLPTLKELSVKYQWQKRLQALLIADIEADKEAEAAAKKKAAEEREKLRLEVERLDLEFHKRATAKALEMMEQPVRRAMRKDPVLDKKGNQLRDGKGELVFATTIVNPVKWDFASAARTHQISSEMARLVLGMPTSRHELTGVNGQPLAPISAPVITVIHKRGASTDAADRERDKFIREHPDHPIVQRYKR